jgi:uncharacterized protein YceK
MKNLVIVLMLTAFLAGCGSSSKSSQPSTTSSTTDAQTAAAGAEQQAVNTQQTATTSSGGSKPVRTATSAKYPTGIIVAGKKGFVKSPYAEYAGLVDVRGFPAGTQVKCPYTQKIFIVP